MANEISRAIFVGLTLWFVSVTAYIVLVARFVDPINVSDGFVLVLFAILSIIVAVGVVATEE